MQAAQPALDTVVENPSPLLKRGRVRKAHNTRQWAINRCVPKWNPVRYAESTLTLCTGQPGTALNNPGGSTVTSSLNGAASTISNGQSGDGNGEQGSINAPALSTTCKKGVGYNDAKYTEKLDICWGYNWASSGEIKQGAMYIPMLYVVILRVHRVTCPDEMQISRTRWGEKSLEGWSDNAKKAIEAGATHILGQVCLSLSGGLLLGPFIGEKND